MAGDRLRVALVAPPWYTVPPSGYGGIEWVVHLLAEELTERGHEVTVFAAEGSEPDGRLVPLAESGLGDVLGGPDHVPALLTYMARVQREIEGDRFDVVHEHNERIGLFAAAFAPRNAATVATIHGDISAAYAGFLGEVQDRVGLVGISQAQIASAPSVDWLGYVYNAVPVDRLAVGLEKDEFFVQVARINPDKGQDLAIEVTRRLGAPLVLAGKVDPDPRSNRFFGEKIEPALGDGVSWIPNVAGKWKNALLARARAMLFPLRWDEPFGLAMVEAMACGTPVVAFRRGAATELVEDGVTGFLVDDVDGMVTACQRLDEIDPRRCAGRARERFSPAAMADGYLAMYRAMLTRWPAPAYR